MARKNISQGKTLNLANINIDNIRNDEDELNWKNNQENNTYLKKMWLNAKFSKKNIKNFLDAKKNSFSPWWYVAWLGIIVSFIHFITSYTIAGLAGSKWLGNKITDAIIETRLRFRPQGLEDFTSTIVRLPSFLKPFNTMFGVQRNINFLT